MSDFTIATMDTSGAKSTAELAAANQANANAALISQHAQALAKQQQDQKQYEDIIKQNVITPQQPQVGQVQPYDPSRRGIAPGDQTPAPVTPPPVQAPAPQAPTLAGAVVPQAVPAPQTGLAPLPSIPQSYQPLPSLSQQVLGSVQPTTAPPQAPPTAPGGPQMQQPQASPAPAPGKLPPSGVPAWDAAQAQMPPAKVADVTHTGSQISPIDTHLAGTFNAADTSVASGKNPQMPSQIITPFGNINAQGVYDQLLASGNVAGAEHFRSLVTNGAIESQRVKIDQAAAANATVIKHLAPFLFMSESMSPAALDQQWQGERQAAIAEGANPDAIPEHYSKDFVDNAVAHATTVAQQLKDQHDDVKDAATTERNKIEALTAAKEKPQDYTEVTLADGVYMVNKNDPTKKIRIGNAPPKAVSQEDKLAALGKLDYSQPLESPTEESYAKNVANGDSDLPNITSKYGQVVAQRVGNRAAYLNGGDIPSQSDRQERKLAITAISPNGSVNQTVTSMKTMAGHAADAVELVDAMKNRDTNAINSLVNKWKTATGDPSITNAQTLLNFLVPEAAKVAHGAGTITDADQDRLIKALNTSGSEAQIKQGLQTIIHAAGRRVGALQDNYEIAKPGHSITEMLDPNTQAVFQKYGVQIPAPSKQLRPIERIGQPNQPAAPVPTSAFTVGQKALKSDGSVLPDGTYNKGTVIVKGGVVTSVGK